MRIEKAKTPPAGRRGRKPKYPFAELKPGTFFAIEGDDRAVHRLHAAKTMWAKRHGVRLKVIRTATGAECHRLSEGDEAWTQ